MNIRFGAGDKRLDEPGYDVRVTEGKIAALAAALRSVTPDIAALQEVKSARQVRRIADILNMKVMYCRHPSSYSLDFFEWGLAFLYRVEKTRQGCVSAFFDESTRAGRHALVAEFSFGGLPVTVVNLHMDPEHIAVQIENVLAFTERVETPTILTGDFNCVPDDPALDPVKRKWIDTCHAVDSPSAREARLKGTVLDGNRRIDYIFVEPELFEVREAGLPPPEHRRVSDHVAYFVDIEWKNS